MMTNEEPLPKKVSVCLSPAGAAMRPTVEIHVGRWARGSDPCPVFPLQVRLSESDMKTLTREELCTR